jgi:hypothetical protein
MIDTLIPLTSIMMWIFNRYLPSTSLAHWFPWHFASFIDFISFFNLVARYQKCRICPLASNLFILFDWLVWPVSRHDAGARAVRPRLFSIRPPAGCRRPPTGRHPPTCSWPLTGLVAPVLPAAGRHRHGNRIRGRWSCGHARLEGAGWRGCVKASRR